MKKIFFILILLQIHWNVNSQSQVDSYGWFGAKASCDGVFTSIAVSCSGNMFSNNSSCETLYGFARGQCNEEKHHKILQSEQQSLNLDSFLDYLAVNLEEDEKLYELLIQLKKAMKNDDLSQYDLNLKKLKSEFKSLSIKKKKIINNFTEQSYSITFYK